MKMLFPLDTDTSGNDGVTVSDWAACLEQGTLALSCTVTTNDSSATITSAVLSATNSDDTDLVACGASLSSGVETVFPSLNLPSSGLSVGDSITAAVGGEADGEHYFFTQSITLAACTD